MLPKTKEAITAWHASGKALLEEYLDGLTPRLQASAIEEGMPNDWDYDTLSDWCEAEVVVWTRPWLRLCTRLAIVKTPISVTSSSP